MSKPATDFLLRIRDKVLLGDGCWLWLGNCSPQGYARLWDQGEKRLAHRLMYERFVGPIPPGLFIDHLCRTRNCIRPDHLEPVTNRENVLRGALGQRTHCPRGHPYDEANTAFYGPRKYRACRCCAREKAAARAKRKRESAHG